MVAGVIVALVSVEGVLRVGFDGKFAPRPEFCVSDQYLGWKTAPNLDHTFFGPDFRIKIKTDVDGYRLGALGEVDYGKELVVLLGDSNAFGWGVSTDETFASFLDERLFEASGGELRLVNLGVAGYGTFQSAHRFKEFLKGHPGARISAIVFVHSKNDPTDNLRTMGYQLGLWKVKSREPKERSRIHIMNLIAYGREVLRQKEIAEEHVPEDIDEIHPYLQDMLFTHEIDSPKAIPTQIDFDGIVVDFENLSREDSSPERMLRRENLTQIQRDVLRVAIRSVYLLAKGRADTIFHFVIPNAPDWIEPEFLAVFDSTPVPDGINVQAIGQYPQIEGYGKNVLNQHSGGHYTPEFNEFWAEAIMDVLVKKKVVMSSNPRD